MKRCADGGKTNALDDEDATLLTGDTIGQLYSNGRPLGLAC